MADLIQTETELEDLLTQPRPVLVEFIRNLPSPLVVLGAGGKMGPTLAVLARRAADAAGHRLDIIAVSRFSDERARAWLESRGVTTLSVDLLEPTAIPKLPDAANVIYLVGLKFGTRENPSLTWAVNTLASAHAAERYTSSRIVALSTGNVYPMAPVASGGATEKHPLTPLGEYANAAVARERVFEYYSDKNATPMALMRLNYAVELRYGVLVDIARRIWAEEPVDVSNGFFNCIWQGDANEMVLRSLALADSPARAWNLTSPDVMRVRDVADRFAQLLGKPARFVGKEAETALVSNSAKLCAELGRPATSLDTVIRWTAHWVKTAGRYLNKPTHFEVRDGSY
jgi:nucleoside-diphosphate-sugar epimerase